MSTTTQPQCILSEQVIIQLTQHSMQLTPLLHITDTSACDGTLLQQYNECIQLFTNKQYNECKSNATDLQQLLHAHINSKQWKHVNNIYRTLYIRITVTLIYSILLSYPNNVVAYDVLIQLIRELDIGIMYAVDNDDVVSHAIKLIHTIQQLLPAYQAKCHDDNKTYKRRKLDTPVITHSVTQASAPTLLTFKQQYLSPNVPVLIADATQHIPAVNKWSIEYLLQHAPYRTVPVEIGANYMSDDWTQKLMTFSEFVDNYIYSDTDTIAYCAQHNLLKQLLALNNDIIIPDYCITNSDVIINTWIGTGNTVSNLHCDPYHNILLQIQGSKYIRLYDKQYAEQLYLYDGIMSNTSQVDIMNVNTVKYPLFNDIPYTECILHSAEMLYIPLGWYHYVQSLDASISVSFWFT